MYIIYINASKNICIEQIFCENSGHHKIFYNCKILYIIHIFFFVLITHVWITYTLMYQIFHSLTIRCRILKLYFRNITQCESKKWLLRYEVWQRRMLTFSTFRHLLGVKLHRTAFDTNTKETERKVINL